MRLRRRPPHVASRDVDDVCPGGGPQAVVAEAARTRRAPLVLSAVTAGVGAGSWGVVQIAAAAGPSAAAGATAVVWAGTAVAVPALRVALRRRITAHWVRRWWVSTSCAACWVDVVASRGADLLDPGVALGAGAALVLGTAALGARWFDEHEVPAPGDEIDEPPQIAPRAAPAAAAWVDPRAAEADAIEQDWDERVAAGKRPLAPGSRLVDREHLVQGWRWTVLLDRDESVTRTALEAEGVTAAIALRLGTSAGHVIVEPLADDPREHLAQLTVVTRDALADGVPYRGPRYHRGAVPIGDYADGTSDALWRLHDQTGVLCGLVTGGQGSGKSGLLAGIGMAARRSGEWVVLFGDGDEGGNSSHLLADVAHDFARGPAEVLQQLEGMEAIAQVRGTLMGTLTVGRDGTPVPMTGPGERPITKMLPCPALPGIVWIIDEFYRLANDPHLQRVDFVDRVEAIVRIMRKYGGCVVVGTQSALGVDFDGNSVLRGMLASGNSAALRSKNKSEQGVVTETSPPSSLPKGGGYAFLGEGDRRAMIRTEHPDGMTQWLSEVIRHGQPDARTWAAFRRYRQVRERDSDVDYAELMTRLAAFDEAVASGAPLPGSPDAGAPSQQPAADEPVSVAGFALPSFGNVIPLHRDEPPAFGDEKAAADESVVDPAGVAEVQLSNSQRAVHDDLLAHPGPQRTAAIVERTGLSAPTVSKALGVLRRHGLAHLPSAVQGVHAQGPAPLNVNTSRSETS